MNEVEKLAFLIRMILYIYGAFFSLKIFIHFTGCNIDDSDKSISNRSGLRVHTDYKTGLQYMSTSGGGVTPRLDDNGNHMRGEMK